MQNQILLFGLDLEPYYEAGWVTVFGYVITFSSFLVASLSYFLSSRTLRQNRKAEMYYKIREYYLGYLENAKNAIDKDVFEISDVDIDNSVFKGRKEELAILYRIPLLVERQFDFSKKFGHKAPIVEYRPYVKGWFRRGNFREMWCLMKPVFYSNKEFCDFMEDCNKNRDLEEVKSKGIWHMIYKKN